MDFNDRILDKLDKLQENMNEMDKTLVRNTDSLELHMKRTDLLEESIKPIRKHVLMAEAVLKLMGLTAVVSSFIAVLYKVFQLLP